MHLHRAFLACALVSAAAAPAYAQRVVIELSRLEPPPDAVVEKVVEPSRPLRLDMTRDELAELLELRRQEQIGVAFNVVGIAHMAFGAAFFGPLGGMGNSTTQNRLLTVMGITWLVEGAILLGVG